MKHGAGVAVVWASCLAGCYSQPTATGTDASGDAGCAAYYFPEGGASVDGGLPIPSSCPTGSSAVDPPTSLTCTGLYSDFTSKTVASAVQAYAPAVPVWSDSATELHWVYLPAGQAIDTSDPNEWVFPIGARFWVQFTRGGSVIETRYAHKTTATNWNFGSYEWVGADAGASPSLTTGGNVISLPDGSQYYIPLASECAECHAGRTDSILGFEAVSLGLSGASGLTLAQLVSKGLVSPAPTLTSLTVGDDGTKLAAAPLAWMHVNCGVSCHNSNPGAFAGAYGMYLRLDPTQLDGGSSADFPSLKTTVGVAATSTTGTRIVAGDPSGSLVYERIDERGSGSVQMPPYPMSLSVDTADVSPVKAWITAMSAPHADAGLDGGADAQAEAGGDAQTDGAVDALPDVGREDVSVPDAHVDGPVRADTGGQDAPREDVSQSDGAGSDASTDAPSDGTLHDGSTPDSTLPDASPVDSSADVESGADGSVDAGVDAGPDAELDSGLDAALDAGLDAPPPDAGEAGTD